jgi:DNA-binding NarL/FixJ family response regulator
MRKAVVQILVVDDYEPFRRFLHLKLQSRPELQIVSVASDGLQAVQKAEELQPDLILLDIGLPKLNGIEAARQIRKSAPQSRIIFVSQESSPDIVQEALSLGTCGYVVKSKADHDLLATVDAVLEAASFSAVHWQEQFTNAMHSASSYDAAADGPIPSLSTHNSVSGIANSVKPQFKQTRSVGKTQTMGLSRPLSPGR